MSLTPLGRPVENEDNKTFKPLLQENISLSICNRQNIYL